MGRPVARTRENPDLNYCRSADPGQVMQRTGNFSMLAQAVVQHHGQVLFRPIRADGPERDVHVVVRAFAGRLGRVSARRTGPSLQVGGLLSLTITWHSSGRLPVPSSGHTARWRGSGAARLRYGPRRGGHCQGLVRYTVRGGRPCYGRSRWEWVWCCLVQVGAISLGGIRNMKSCEPVRDRVTDRSADTSFNNSKHVVTATVNW